MSKNIRMKVSDDITIEQGFERFLRWCRLKGFSEYTIEFYDESRMNFARFKDLDAPIGDINRELLEDYILFLQDTDVSSVTIFIYAKGLKRVFNYFMDEELIEPFNIELPKMETPVKAVYTESELRKLLKKPNLKKCRFSEYRNWVIVNYLLGTGQRRNTVTNLKIGDVDLDNRLVRLRVTKSKRETILPLTNSLVTSVVKKIHEKNQVWHLKIQSRKQRDKQLNNNFQDKLKIVVRKLYLSSMEDEAEMIERCSEVVRKK